jgi:hypothetical protein
MRKGRCDTLAGDSSAAFLPARYRRPCGRSRCRIASDGASAVAANVISLVLDGCSRILAAVLVKCSWRINPSNPVCGPCPKHPARGTTRSQKQRKRCRERARGVEVRSYALQTIDPSLRRRPDAVVKPGCRLGNPKGSAPGAHITVGDLFTVGDLSRPRRPLS